MVGAGHGHVGVYPAVDADDPGRPGQPDTAWSAIWDGGKAGGSYFVQARVRDTAANGDAVHATTRFTVV